MSFPLLRFLYHDYVDWLHLGPGGIPHNPLGYMVQCILRVIASRDLRSTECYRTLKTTHLEKQSFMDVELPVRIGWTPKTGKWCIPHRQLSETATKANKQTVTILMEELAMSNPSLIKSRPSKIEGGAPALFVGEILPNHARYARIPEEFFHIHAVGEGSAHAILSATDASLAIERGWAERHGLAGRGLGFPLTYLMIFAPRNDDEVKTVIMIAKAAARYALEGKAIN